MYNKPIAVRILPMDAELEFYGATAEEVQQSFFLNDLPTRDPSGMYEYRVHGLNASHGTVVLFQYQNSIIARAILDSIERFDSPEDDYSGAFYFKANSIRVFDPIGANEMREIWPSFKRFSQSKQRLDPSRFQNFIERLSRIRGPVLSYDISAPPDRARVLVSRIIRDSAQSGKVKELNNFECQICGYTLEKSDGTFYAEAHHIKPLGKPHNGPDVLENIICLCPNHHAACDLGVIRLNVNDFRISSGHSISQEYIDYHNEKIYEDFAYQRN